MRKLAVLATCVFLLAGCQQQEPPSAFGTLERDAILYRATSSEPIVEIAVKKGQQVAEGALLLRFDEVQQRLMIAQLEAELAQKKASDALMQKGARTERFIAAQARIDGVQAKLKEIGLSLKRAKTLEKQRNIAEGELERVQAEYQVTQAELVQAQQQLAELVHGNQPEELEQSAQGVLAAQARLQQAQQRLLDLSLYAQNAGMIEALPWQQGERVPVGAVVLKQTLAQQPYARIYLPERMLSQWQVGQNIGVWVDGASAVIPGKIRFISPTPAFTPHFALHQNERTRLVYLTEIALPDSTRLPSGTPVRVELP
ncbi:hypothetical protein BTE48_12105 [Oceanospirillum multiglobuliferum]|uniref:Uncharacterized protein n=2 Tax=Oceanospirillum multiglobuliferum TaxID=64969 RepID=A0A1V4T2M6_9GAMM|nr:hypothetical protein BTE48_12105 [Oceanospirillum multiglobuliferum]